MILAYFIFAAHKYGARDGLLISFLSWSFFVLCTPIADAGILIDFPMNLITGIKMVYSEMIVWTIAITLNLITYFTNPAIYSKTILLSLFHEILKNPFPYWIVILISAMGTFLSVYIADNFVNPKRKKDSEKHTSFLIRHKIIIFIFLVTIVILTYNFLLTKLGVKIPLI